MKLKQLISAFAVLSLSMSCNIDDPNQHAYISFWNNSDIPVAFAYDYVELGYFMIPDADVDHLEKAEYLDMDDLRSHTKKIVAPHTKSNNYLHYWTTHPSLVQRGWETAFSGILYLYFIDGSEPNEDVLNRTYGTDKLLGIYKLSAEDLKTIDYKVVYPPDEAYQKYWIEP